MKCPRKDIRESPVVVGILGGIGCGKSTVAGMLEKLGAAVIDADAIAHEVLDRPPVRRKVARLWGAGVVSRKSGMINRRELAALVFGKAAEIVKLNAIIHPKVRQRVKAEIRRLGRALPRSVVVLDVPLLMESGLLGECDTLVYVHASAARRRERVCRTRGWKASDWRRRESRQSGLKNKRAIADYIIDNSGVSGSTFSQVRKVFQEIQPQVTAARTPMP